MSPTPINIDFKKVRKQRQVENDKRVFNNITNSKMNQKELNKCININELRRVEETEECECTELFKLARKSPEYGRLLGMMISKKTSRQGAKDEALQIETCNQIAEQCNINIKQLNNNDLCPTTCGKILSKKNITKRGLSIADGLKSFDAKISGKINGYMSCKVTFDDGGHQKNVLNEMKALINWWINTKQKSVLIILWDTNLEKKLQELKNTSKYHENIKVMTHTELQEYMINEFHEEPVSNNQDSDSDDEESSSECSESDVIVYEGKDDRI